MTKEILIPIVIAIAGVGAGAASTWLLQKLNRRRQVHEQVVDLQFEVELNVEWADNVFQSLNYLRDEAWVALKKDGHVGYLNSSIRKKIARVYDRTHGLNRCIKTVRELSGDAKKEYIAQSEVHRHELIACSQELLREMETTELP